MNKPNWIYPVKRLVLSDQVGRWCQIPYDGHPKGCPKYGKAEKCPPRAPAAGEYFDLSRPLWLVHSEFNLAGHVIDMWAKHPAWSERQCRCVLYWQSTSRKQLKERIHAAITALDADASTLIPEAMGVNVYVTARVSGLRLERITHLSTCRHVALIGTEKNGQMRLF